METQFKYIVDLAKEYHNLSQNPDSLLKTVNEISRDTLEEIFKEYQNEDSKFQPVNLLRAEIARLVLSGTKITEELIETIKERIRKRDVTYFKNLSAEYLKQLQEYPQGRRDMFANWQKLWGVLHTFLYRGQVKDTTRNYLEQLCSQLTVDLNLKDYSFHWVDFYGASNYGSDWCWLALYPAHKFSHQEAYQFFIRFSHEPQAGRIAGHSLKKSVGDKLKGANTFNESIIVLKEFREEIIALNNSSKNYFKFAPGSQASEWTKFYSTGIAAISYSGFNLGDLSKIDSREDINIKAGLPSESQSNQTWNLWLFKTANKGDVIFANKGVNTCIGIGIIEGPYYYEQAENGYNHRRKVKWLTNKVYQYKADSLKGYKTLFRADTFSPTKVWEFLLSEYARLYPELRRVFDDNQLVYSVESKPSVVDEPSSEYDPGEDAEPINFWWLNANPKIWSISNHSEGQKQTYTTHNEKGNKRRIYKYFEAAKPGDLIIGYESTPTKQIKAIYEVTKGIHNGQNGEEIEFELVEKLEVPVHWNDLKNNPGLEKCEVFINNQGSLFKLTDEEYDIIREVIDNKNIIGLMT